MRLPLPDELSLFYCSPAAHLTRNRVNRAPHITTRRSPTRSPSTSTPMADGFEESRENAATRLRAAPTRAESRRNVFKRVMLTSFRRLTHVTTIINVNTVFSGRIYRLFLGDKRRCGPNARQPAFDSFVDPFLITNFKFADRASVCESVRSCSLLHVLYCVINWLVGE